MNSLAVFLILVFVFVDCTSDGGEMQTDWLFKGLLPDADGFLLFILLGGPAVILMVLTVQLKRIVRNSLDGGTTSDGLFASSYKVHPDRWNLTYRISSGVAILVVTLWFLFVYGFVCWLFVFIVIVASGKGSSALLDKVGPPQ